MCTSSNTYINNLKKITPYTVTPQLVIFDKESRRTCSLQVFSKSD